MLKLYLSIFLDTSQAQLSISCKRDMLTQAEEEKYELHL